MSCAQRALHLAQLASDRQHVAAELLDRLPIVLAQDHRAAFASLLELGELVLHLLELGGERLLLLAVAALGVAPQLIDELERAVLGAAPAQRDQRLRAREVVERVDHEGGIAGIGDRHLLAHEIAHVDPELVVQQIGVGDDDGIDLARGHVRLGGRGRLGLLLLGLVVLGLIALGPGLGRILGLLGGLLLGVLGAIRLGLVVALLLLRLLLLGLRGALGERTVGRAGDARRQCQRLTLGLVGAQEGNWIGHAGELLRRDLHRLRAGHQDRRHLRGGALGLGEEARRCRG